MAVDLKEKFQQELLKNTTLRNFPIQVEIQENIVVLLGSVKTYHQKQIALAIASKCLVGLPFSIDSRIEVA